MSEVPNFPYTVRIRRNSDGEIRMTKPYPFEFSLYWWMDGNYSCDCNRHMEFERAKTPLMEWDEFPCTIRKNAYTALDATLATGEVVPLDEDPE